MEYGSLWSFQREKEEEGSFHGEPIGELPGENVGDSRQRVVG